MRSACVMEIPQLISHSISRCLINCQPEKHRKCIRNLVIVSHVIVYLTVFLYKTSSKEIPGHRLIMQKNTLLAMSDAAMDETGE